MIPLLAGLAFIPMLVYSFAFWSLDRHEREPLPLIVGMFVWGAVPAIAIAVFIEASGAATLDGSAHSQWTFTVLFGPLVEECAKGLGLVGLLLFARREIDSMVDGVLYGTLVGFGFSATEDMIYFIRAHGEGGFTAVWQTALVRSYLTGLAHSIFSSCLGVAVAVARHRARPWSRIGWVTAGLASATVLHCLWNNGSLPMLPTMLAGGAILAGLARHEAIRERSWVRRELQSEVTAGVLTPTELITIGSAARRSRALIAELWFHGWKAWAAKARFYRTAIELAFEKRHREHSHDPSPHHRSVLELRRALEEQRRRATNL